MTALASNVPTDLCVWPSWHLKIRKFHLKSLFYDLSWKTNEGRSGNTACTLQHGKIQSCVLEVNILSLVCHNSKHPLLSFTKFSSLIYGTYLTLVDFGVCDLCTRLPWKEAQWTILQWTIVSPLAIKNFSGVGLFWEYLPGTQIGSALGNSCQTSPSLDLISSSLWVSELDRPFIAIQKGD